jgi:acetylornithine deacetylase/succinyl-diaminopimelate desuccinylase-like protein
MFHGMKEILARLPDFSRSTEPQLEVLLSNLVMVGEIPAPTHNEYARMKYLLGRFAEYELINCSTDEAGNALGILPGTDGKKNMLVTAHLDTPFPAKTDHTINLTQDIVQGPGVADNSLGLAAIATLPLYLDALKIKLKANLILMGATKSLGRGNIEGVRFFLNNTEFPIHIGVCVEGVKLGRLSYSSVGMLRGEIINRVPDSYDWSRFGAGGSIVNINDVINKILELPLPQRPKSSIVLGALFGGTSFHSIPHEATLQFEARSESEAMVKMIEAQIHNIVAEIASLTGTEVDFTVLARRSPGGIQFSHPLAANARALIEEIGITPRISPSTSELSAFIDKGIPAVTIGISDGERLNEAKEALEIAPIRKGMAQLIGLILAIDRGYCDEHK